MIRIIVFIGLIFVFGCNISNKSSFKVPEPNKMAQILADVHLAEATVASSTFKITTSDQNKFYSGLLKKYSLNKTEFDSAVAFYSANPVVYQKIYEQVIEILTQREMEVLAIKENTSIASQKAIKDTINDLWKGERSFSFSTKESSVTKNIFFVDIVDSIASGNLLFTANYQIKPLERDGIKALFIVDYIDKSKDSIHFDLPKDTTFLKKEFEIKLPNKRVLKLSGQYVEFPVNKPITVTLKDIELKWIPSKVHLNPKIKNVLL